MTIFVIGQKLLASQLNDMNIERIAANSGFQTVGVGSFGTVNASSGFQTSEVGSFGTVNASSGFQTSEVGSFGSVDVSSWLKGPGIIVTGQSSLGSIITNSGVLLAIAPSPPIANEAYRDSIIKGWALFDNAAVDSSNPVNLTGVRDSFNVLGVQDEGTGQAAVHWLTSFSTGSSYICSGFAGDQGLVDEVTASRSASKTQFTTRAISTGSPADRTFIQILAIGDQ